LHGAATLEWFGQAASLAVLPGRATADVGSLATQRRSAGDPPGRGRHPIRRGYEYLTLDRSNSFVIRESNGRPYRRITAPDELAQLERAGRAAPPYRGLCTDEQYEQLKSWWPTPSSSHRPVIMSTGGVPARSIESLPRAAGLVNPAPPGVA